MEEGAKTVEEGAETVEEAEEVPCVKQICEPITPVFLKLNADSEPVEVEVNSHSSSPGRAPP